MEYFFWIIQYLLGTIEVYTNFKYCELAFKSKNKDYKKYIICSLFISIFITINRTYRYYSILILVFAIAIVSILVKAVQKEYIKNIALLVSMYYFTLTLLDMFIIFLLAVLLEQPSLGTEIGRNLGSARILVISITRGILFIPCLFPSKKLETVLSEILNYKKYVLLFICLEIGGVFCFQEVYAKGITIRLETSWYLFCFILIIISIIIFGYVFYRNVKEEKELLKLKNEMLELNYRTTYKCYKDSMKIFHDMKGHLNTIYQLIIHEQYQRVVDYLNTIQEPINQLEISTYSGNYIIDLVLNYKFFQMNNNKIKVETSISPIDNNIGILDGDLCAVLNNLLNNAIEANQDVLEAKRWIKVSISQVNKMLIIKVSNSIFQQPAIVNGKYITTKKNKNLHGYGIESIENIADKYEGFFSCQSDQQTFTATLTLGI